MKIDLFYYLLEVNRLHSISAAARSLHIKQTTLSAAIKTAETELGYSIFARTPSGVETTPTGEKFMEYAWNIYVDYDELVSLKTRLREVPKFINILVSPVFCGGFCIDLISNYYQYGLSSSLTFTTASSEQIPSLICANAANIGIDFCTGADFRRACSEVSDLKFDPLFQDSRYVYMSTDHPLASYDAIQEKDLFSFPVARIIRSEYHSLTGEIGHIADNSTSFGNLDLVLQAVSQLGMIAVLPGFVRHSASYRSKDNLVVLPLIDTQPCYCCLVHRKSRNLRYHEKIILNCIRDCFSSLDGIILLKGDTEL